MTLLEELSELIIPALDNRMFVVMCAVDLKSAFDALDHPVLLEKFKNVGIHHPLLENYFTNRTQVVKIGKELSNKRNIEFGLVQGGINSPLWYNLYTYDIKYLQMNGEIKMFADDTAIINIHKNLDIAIKNTQEDLITLQKYFYSNSIFINNEKTEILSYLFVVLTYLFRCKRLPKKKEEKEKKEKKKKKEEKEKKKKMYSRTSIISTT
ncbi:hypothetical protein M8J77_001047 [Diaphorina citri]|nr:hypothetical protein M8J77_001047 [Diaphorina citri]